MEASVDTLVYQLEDEDPRVRGETLQKLRKIAAVESAHFPVRNPRRFLHCVRRRIIDDEPQNALEALRLVTDIMGVLGDDVDQILSSILPHLVPNLPQDDHKATGETGTLNHVALYEETFQVFRKYVVVSNDLKAVVELLMNMGLAHTTPQVREASILAIVRLLDERYARKTKGARVANNFKANRMDKALFVSLFQALVPVLEDANENVVVVTEEAVGKLHLYWGDGIEDLMGYLSSEDRRTLHQHQEHIDEFIEASSVSSDTTTPSSLGSTSSSTAALSRLSSPELNDQQRASVARPSPSSSSPPLNKALHYGFVDHETLEALKASTSNSNADWKKRSAAVEKLFSALKSADPEVLQRHLDEMEELFDIVTRLMQDADVHLVKRAIQITHLCFHKFSRALQEDEDTAVQSSSSPQNAAYYVQKMVPHLVETAANFVNDDKEMEAHLYALFTALFANGFLSVARANQTLMSSLQHRRLQVREEACKVWIVLLLIAQREGFNTSKVLSHNVLQVLGRLLGDSSTRVKEMASEVGAVLAVVLARGDLAELVEENLDEYLVQRVDMDVFRRRLRLKHLPVLLESGLLSLPQQSNKKTPTTATASVRNSYGSLSPATKSGVERSLSSVSELHMLASRDIASSQSLEQPTVVRQSRHVAPTTESAVRSSYTKDEPTSNRTPTAPESKRGPPASASKFGYQAASYGTKIASLGTVGSMSDRSYFNTEDGDGAPQLTSSSSEPVADKLSMLKKKATQLRKSSSSRQVHNVSGLAESDGDSYGCSKKPGNEKSNQLPPMRSQTSPERYGDRVDYEDSEPAVSARRVRKEGPPGGKVMSRIPVTKSTAELAEASPQKIQMLQSSGAAIANGNKFKDRPIVSKYAAVTSKSQELSGGYGNEDSEGQGYTHSTPRLRSYEDRPIPTKAHVSPVKSTSADHYGDSGNNDIEAPRKRAQPRVASAARRSPDADDLPVDEQPVGKQHYSAPDENDESTEDTYVPSGKAAAARPISLATRKRLEAKAKQDSLLQQQFSSPPKSDTYVPDVAPPIGKEPKPLQKKASVISMAKAGIPATTTAGDDSSKSARAFGGKQEPKYLELHEIKPLANPKQETAKLLEKIRGTDWEATFDALSVVRRLAMHHPSFLENQIHAATKEILAQVPNLRSTVSKNSLLALESMCAAYQKAMDPEVDAILAMLIKRSADSNTFVCESATSSINSVILHCSASKVVNALAVHLGSKAVPLRREVARAMHTLIVSMADQVTTSKDLGTILNIVGKCLEDSNNEVRDAAKQSILYLCYEQRLDAEKLKRMMSAGGARAKVDQVLSGSTRYTPAANAVATIKAPVKAAMTAKSASPPPVAASVAQQGKPETSSRTGSSSSSSSGSGSTAPATRKAPPSSSTSATVDTVALERLQKSLESSNWKDRYDALQEATTFVCSSARGLTESGKVIGLFDLIIKRMEDGNAKVNVFALECLEKMVPALGSSGMELVLSSFLPALTKNLAANNPKLSTLTLSVVQVLCTHVDAKLLCQHFAAIARHANSRIKPLLIDTLEQLTLNSDEKNQYALNRYVLPLALELVKEAKSDVKDANTRLLRALYANLGPTMLQAVYKQSTSQQERISAILGISAFAK